MLNFIFDNVLDSKKVLFASHNDELSLFNINLIKYYFERKMIENNIILRQNPKLVQENEFLFADDELYNISFFYY
jgi:hypothetical protein